MLLTSLKKNSAKQISISWLISFTMVGMSLLTTGGAVSADSIMIAKSPCTFSVQLQKSVPVRKRYLVKLSALVGGTVPVGGAVDDMYGNIKEASYNPATVEEEDLLGFGPTVKRENPELDPFSSDCLCCHDGAGAVSVAVDWRNNPARLRTLKQPHGTDHPIGMDYESYVANGRDYRSVSGLNTKMVFVNGRVGCLTCHDPMNPEKGHLVMSDRGSALCLTCHSR
jgi:predicted CXXCH cytochrome family protein